jgi:hypothetical protein
VAIHAAASTLVCALYLPDRRESTPRASRSGVAALLLGVGVVILLSNLTWSLKYRCGRDFLSAGTPVTVLKNTWADFEF